MVEGYNETLRLVAVALNASGVKWSCIGGTALALIRGIGEDVDIDIGVFGDIEVARKALIAARGVYEHGFGVPECGHQYSVVVCGIKVDLFRIYELDEKRLWSAAWVGGVNDEALCEMIAYWYMRFEPLGWLDGIFIPSTLDLFCEEQYGPEWRVPIAAGDWNYAEDARNARHTGVYCRQNMGVGG